MDTQVRIGDSSRLTVTPYASCEGVRRLEFTNALNRWPWDWVQYQTIPKSFEKMLDLHLIADDRTKNNVRSTDIGLQLLVPQETVARRNIGFSSSCCPMFGYQVKKPKCSIRAKVGDEQRKPFLPVR